MPNYPAMAHLPEFWDPENWTDSKWETYLEKKRSSFKKRLGDWIDQWLHRRMGKIWTRKCWEARETDQWPSSTGSYDPCSDHYNWLCGAGLKETAEALKREAQRRRPEFLTWV